MNQSYIYKPGRLIQWQLSHTQGKYREAEISFPLFTFSICNQTIDEYP